MTSWLKKNSLSIFLILIIIVVYFVLRIPNLTLQPIFVDEAIYIRWAQVMRSEPSLRFLPLIDGKTPLFMWTLIPILKIFNDPLFAGRFLSVIFGFITLLGTLFLGWKFFDKNVGMFAAFLVAVTPFMVFFDRMALVDSMLTAFSIWSLNLAMLILRSQRLDLAMSLGYILGGAMLTKTPGSFNVAILPTTLLAFKWQQQQKEKKLLKIIGLWLVALIIALAIYNILRLGPGFNNLNSRNQDYIFSPVDIYQRPLDPFLPHLNILFDWFVRLITVPTLLLLAFAIVMSFRKKDRIVLAILVWALVPILVQTALLKVFTARYILFSIPPLLVIAGYGVSNFKRFMNCLLLLIIISPLALYFDYLLLTQPENAPLPDDERSGYFEMWTAGYGVKEIATFIDNESIKQPVVLGTEGRFGTLPDGIQIYLDQNRRVAFIPGSGIISAELRTAAYDHPTYFVSNGSYLSVKDRLEFIKEFPKADKRVGKKESMILFKVLP